jgi:hypothetical protein
MPLTTVSAGTLVAGGVPVTVSVTTGPVVGVHVTV